MYGGTGARRVRLDILDGRALQRTHEVGFPLCAPLPIPPVDRPNRWDNLPVPSFPSTRANPLNPMKDEGFVQSLESGGKRFLLLAGSNRRNLVFRERASLAVKVQSNRVFIGPFVGVAEEICHENSSEELASCGRPVIFIHNGAPAGAGWLLSLTPVQSPQGSRPGCPTRPTSRHTGPRPCRPPHRRRAPGSPR